MRIYRGDVGLFRMALEGAGFEAWNEYGQARRIFSDTYPRDTGRKPTKRRLKLYYGVDVSRASKKKQAKLEQELRKLFGKRFISCGPHSAVDMYGYGFYSYVVFLKP